MFKINNEKLYIVFLALLATTPALATDMYLSAIPQIATQWCTTHANVNLSLVLWFVFYSFCLLVSGPVSDKYGRKPVLLGGLALFVVSSFLCAAAQNVVQLVVFRILQGIAAAAPASMAIAVCRDKYEGTRRQQILAYIAVILSVSPMLAPTLGTFVMNLLSWRYIFITQALLVVISFIISLGFTETNTHFLTEDLLHSFTRYKKVLSNRRYVLACVVMGMISGPFLGYIAFSPIVYMNIFGLSDKVFSLIFGLNATAAMTGSFTCGRIAKKFSNRKMLTLSFSGCVLGSTGVLLFGSLHAVIFAAFMLVFSFCCGLSRPASLNIILGQVNEDIGSASSLALFYQIMAGSLCMWLFSRPWPRPILVFASVATGVSVLILTLWPILLRMLDEKKPA